MVNLGPEKFEEYNGQDIAGNKAAEKKFLRNRLYIFYHSQQEFLHARFLTDHWMGIKLCSEAVYCSGIGVFV
jgi:hypothetical protein